MPLAIEVDINHLFFWDPIWLEGTPFAINRVVLLMLFASFVCMAFFLLAARKKRVVPSKLQSMAETAYLGVRNNIAIDTIGPEGAKYAPYLAAVFFFIFFNNLLEIIPGINFPTPSRMAIPIFLALLTWLIFNIVGIAKQGPFRYFKGTLFPPGLPGGVTGFIIKILLAIIELFSVFIIRPLTLAIRLLANMMAGHVLLTIFFLFTHDFLVENLTPISAPMGLITLAVACLLIVFELLVITIQAYIFTMLTAFYIAESIHGHGDHDEDHAHAEAPESARQTELQPA